MALSFVREVYVEEVMLKPSPLLSVATSRRSPLPAAPTMLYPVRNDWKVQPTICTFANPGLYMPMFVPIPVKTGLAAAHLIVMLGAPIVYAKGVVHVPPINVVLRVSTVPQGGTWALTATGARIATAETNMATARPKLRTALGEGISRTH